RVKRRICGMITEKSYAICLLKILEEYSDETHIMQMNEIIRKMNEIYGISPDRRTIYSAAALLIDLGYDISLYEENGRGYYFRTRLFEPSEVLLLTDAVFQFPFITAKQTDSLVAKLQAVLSRHQRKRYRHLTVSKSEWKTVNRQVFLNIEMLDEAIEGGFKVRFGYYDYGTDKELHPRREAPYIVNPFRMYFTNGRYYLFCSMSGSDYSGLYRIDKIRDLEILEERADADMPDERKIRSSVYAFAGKPERIRFRCDRCIIGDVLEQFGKDVFVQEDSDRDVLITFTAPPGGILFWALQYLPYVEVLEPDWLRNEVITCMRRKRYGK
ncbi:MAG: helix-turn-helix transcriptional regulator, partial [Lachnospiraceae bacterium]